MRFIKTIPLGKIHSVYDNLCDDLDDSQKVHGCYWNVGELLVRLAEFYLSGFSGHTINWFGQEYTFFVILGGDGFGSEMMDQFMHFHQCRTTPLLLHI